MLYEDDLIIVVDKWEELRKVLVKKSSKFAQLTKDEQIKMIDQTRKAGGY